MADKIRHDFFDQVDQFLATKEVWSEEHSIAVFNSGLKLIDRLNKEYTKPKKAYLVPQVVTQINERIDRLEIKTNSVRHPRDKLLIGFEVEKRILGIVDMDEVKLNELEILENQMEMLSLYSGSILEIHKRILNLMPDTSRDLPLMVIAGVCFYRIGFVVTRKNQKDILTEFSFKGKGGKLYEIYAERWVKENKMTIISKSKFNYYPQIIELLKSIDAEASKKASEDFKKLTYTK